MADAQGKAQAARYIAFISYSHADKRWGDWLHKALETYRVPARFVGRDTGRGPIPKRLVPIFRDKDELPSSADLGRIINEALEQSRALIVICSRAAAQSRWVNEEILAFKKLGRADRIFALIVEGEPAESFPPALQETEPIAADARKGQDTKADAMLRLLAGLMGVSYDELKQRERQRRKRRIILNLAASLAVVVAVAIPLQRAWRTHRALAASAPAYYANAEALLGKGKRDEALQKINAAIALNPDRANFHFLRGNILLSSDVRAALHAYEEALRLDPGHTKAKQNRELCAKVIADNPDAKSLPEDAFFEMVAQTMEQGRMEVALQMIRDFAALKGMNAEQMWRNHLQSAGIEGSGQNWFSIDAQGAVSLSLSESQVSDIHALRGMPLQELMLARTTVRDLAALKGIPLRSLNLARCSNIRDLTPLQGMPLLALNLNECKHVRSLTPLSDCRDLRELVLPPNPDEIAFLRRLPNLERISYQQIRRGSAGWTPAQTAEEFWKNPHPPSPEETVALSVEEMLNNLAADATEVSFSQQDISDLSPLAGRPIQRLSLGQTKVTDVTPLAGMPLEELNLSRTSVRDVTPLGGMPLRRLNLARCKFIRDITPLAECADLRELVLPPNATEIEFLRRLPNLERISYRSVQQGNSWTPSQTAEAFWKNPHPASSEESVEEALNNLAADATEVSFSQQGISDLSPLAGRPIRRLSLSGTKVTDLTPLAGMPLEELILSRTPVRNLTALKGMPLRRLNVNDCRNIRDLTPLAACKELRELVLPPNATEIEFLRRLPNLERISYNSMGKGAGWTPAQTAEEFWANPHPAAPEEPVDQSVEEMLNNLPADATEVSFNKTDISDLSPLAGRPIRRLSLYQTKVTDLTPLADMPLEELMLSQTSVRDLAALKGMPLRKLNLARCKYIRDITPLAECAELSELVLPPNATEIEFLRRLPNLERISYQSTQRGSAGWTPRQTAEAFWREYDEGRGAEARDGLSVSDDDDRTDSGDDEYAAP